MIDSSPIIEPSRVTTFADSTFFIFCSMGEIDFLYFCLCVAYKYLLNDGTSNI